MATSPSISWPDLSEVLHFDRLTGAFAEFLALVTPPSTNTIPALGVYEGLSHDELFPAPLEVPAVQVRERWRTPLVSSEDLVFRSPHEHLEPRFAARYRAETAENHTVYARRIRPAGWARRPSLLYYHGYLQPETAVEEMALLVPMAMVLGVEVVQIQPPYHGRRAPRSSWYSGALYWTADMVRSVESLRQSMIDARALLSWMLAEDSRPVGVSGLSLGGALALVLTCVEPRLAFSAPLAAHMDLGAIVRDVPVLARMRRELAAFGWREEDVVEFFTRLGWDTLRPRIPADRILLVAASNDRFFDPRLVEDLWRRWCEPQIHWVATSHMGFVSRVPETMSVMRELIDRVDHAGTVAPSERLDPSDA